MLVFSIPDISDKSLLIGERGATAKALWDKHKISINMERTQGEQQAMRTITQYPAFQRAKAAAKECGTRIQLFHNHHW